MGVCGGEAQTDPYPFVDLTPAKQEHGVASGHELRAGTGARLGARGLGHGPGTGREGHVCGMWKEG